jgi:hypothetical protein
MPLLTPRLCILDRHDGTGADAHVLGSSFGATNTIYTFSLDGITSRVSPVECGEIAHDGELALILSVGNYYGYIVSELDSDAVTSGVVTFSVTSDGLVLDLAEQAAEALRQHVQALGLPNLAVGKSLMRKSPLRSLKELGKIGIGVLACPVTESRAPAPDFAMDTIQYRTQLALFRASNQDLTAYLRDELQWRERIIDTLTEQPPAGADGAYLSLVTPGMVADPSAFDSQIDLGSITVAVTSQETRMDG